MTTDDDIKAAEAHANRVCPEMGPEFCVWGMSKQDFLAGVVHARKPHVVADGDLPEYSKDVIALCLDDHFRIMPLEFDGAGSMWWQSDSDDLDLYFVKYWWPLPKLEK